MKIPITIDKGLVRFVMFDITEERERGLGLFPYYAPTKENPLKVGKVYFLCETLGFRILRSLTRHEDMTVTGT